MEADHDRSIASFRNDLPAPAYNAEALAKSHAAMGGRLAHLAPCDPAIYREERRGVQPIESNDAHSITPLNHCIGEADDVLL